MNKRVIFTTVCVLDDNWKDHKHTCVLLIESIIKHTPYSIIVLTDDIPHFEKYNLGERVLLYDIFKYTDQPLYFNNFFNCNLKYLPLKIAFEFECDYTIFVDCDTFLNTWDDKYIDRLDTDGYDVYAPYGSNKVGMPVQMEGNAIALQKLYEIGELWDDSMSLGPLIQEINIVFKKNKIKQDTFISTFEKIANNSIKTNTQKTFESYFFGASMGMANMNFQSMNEWGVDPPSYLGSWNIIHARNVCTITTGVIKPYSFEELLLDIKNSK